MSFAAPKLFADVLQSRELGLAARGVASDKSGGVGPAGLRASLRLNFLATTQARAN
jgi:hypothetical protein